MFLELRSVCVLRPVDVGFDVGFYQALRGEQVVLTSRRWTHLPSKQSSPTWAWRPRGAGAGLRSFTAHALRWKLPWNPGDGPGVFTDRSRCTVDDPPLIWKALMQGRQEFPCLQTSRGSPAPTGASCPRAVGPSAGGRPIPLKEWLRGLGSNRSPWFFNSKSNTSSVFSQ